MAEDKTELPLHTRIATDLLDGRSAVGSPRISPDGEHVACVVSTIDLDANTNISRVWLDGAPITAGPYDNEPTWSPDGRWLAFTSRRGEKKGDSTLHVLPIGGPGELRTVCEMPDGLGDLAWSPDGRWIAFTSRTRDPRYETKDVSWQAPRKIEHYFTRLNGDDWVFDRPQHIYVIAADGTSKPRNLTPGKFQHDTISWLADSSGVATTAARHDTWDLDLATDIYIAPLDGEIRLLTDSTGTCSAPAVSPDGTGIAFIGAENSRVYPQNYRVGLIPTSGGAIRWVSTALDRTFQAGSCPRSPIWIDDKTLLAVAEDRGDTHLYRVHIDATPPEPVTSGPLTVTGFDHAGGVLATTRSTVERSGELFVDRNGTETRLTHVTVDRRGWEKFGVPCADGSDEIDAWIMIPEGFDSTQRYPVLLNVHGGPFSQYGELFFDEAQMQSAAGFVVLMSNPRGGSGRHTGWGQSIIGPKHSFAPGSGWGSVDVDDVIAVLDTALTRYSFCDRDRVGMLGGSYGGYMATMLASRYSGRFAAVCSERSVNNLLTEEWSSDIGSMFQIEHGPNPVEDPDEYRRMSPIHLARDITVPMLLIHSEEDYRCPINQAEELWMTLRMLGKDATFYRFPGENHELSRSGSPVHRRMRAEIILDFFAEKLKRNET